MSVVKAVVAKDALSIFSLCHNIVQKVLSNIFVPCNAKFKIKVTLRCKLLGANNNRH